MDTHIKQLLSTCTLGMLLSSCAVGPNYHRPETVLSTQFKEAKGKAVVLKNKDWKPIHPQDDAFRGEWWTMFHDPLLNELETQLNQYNQNIANAEANYRQSMAIVDQARASYFPTITGLVSLFRQKQSGIADTTLNNLSTTSTGTGSGTGTSTGTSTAIGSTSGATTTTYTATLNASWEPDIWGLVRRTVEADLSIAQSNAALVAVTRLSAQGALAQYYFELRTLDTDQMLLDNTVKAYQKALRLTRHQYASGIVSRADIVQAQTQLETAQALALNNGILRGQYEHAIAVLIGRPPAFVTLKRMPTKAKPPVIPVDIPSVWLERRPDVAQAERLVQKNSALIGVAVAAYFPTLTLTGSATAVAKTLNDLVNRPALGWSAGMQLAETIFDGGYRSATVRAAKEAYLAQVATYRQTVLAAFQDVEDNLVALRILREQSIVQNKAAASAQKALQLVMNQYKAGTVAYSNVISAQIIAFNNQKTANDVSGLQLTAAVNLIKALGGGWAGEQTDKTNH